MQRSMTKRLITYPMAIVGACQFGQLVERDRTKAISDYKRALAMGNTRSLSDLFGAVGVAFLFNQQAIEDALQFILEKYQGENNGLGT